MAYHAITGTVDAGGTGSIGSYRAHFMGLSPDLQGTIASIQSLVTTAYGTLTSAHVSAVGVALSALATATAADVWVNYNDTDVTTGSQLQWLLQQAARMVRFGQEAPGS